MYRFRYHKKDITIKAKNKKDAVEKITRDMENKYRFNVSSKTLYDFTHQVKKRE